MNGLNSSTLRNINLSVILLQEFPLAVWLEVRTTSRYCTRKYRSEVCSSLTRETELCTVVLWDTASSAAGPP